LLLLQGSVKAKHVSDFFLNDVIKDSKNMTIVMDNARSHHSEAVKKVAEDTNTNIVYTIPYNPQYAPVEYLNNVVKNKLKKEYRNDVTNMEISLEKIIRKIPGNVYKNCFDHAYKHLQQKIAIS